MNGVSGKIQIMEKRDSALDVKRENMKLLMNRRLKLHLQTITLMIIKTLALDGRGSVQQGVADTSTFRLSSLAMLYYVVMFGQRNMGEAPTKSCNNSARQKEV